MPFCFVASSHLRFILSWLLVDSFLAVSDSIYACVSCIYRCCLVPPAIFSTISIHPNHNLSLPLTAIFSVLPCYAFYILSVSFLVWTVGVDWILFCWCAGVETDKMYPNSLTIRRRRYPNSLILWRSGLDFLLGLRFLAGQQMWVICFIMWRWMLLYYNDAPAGIWMTTVVMAVVPIFKTSTAHVPRAIHIP